MEGLLHILMWVSLVLLFGGVWTENFAVGQMQRNGWYQRQGWKRFFISTKRLIEAHEKSGGDPAWIRLQRIANAGIIVGFAAALGFVATVCIAARMHLGD